MKEILIESRMTLDRVAMLEDGHLLEVHYEDKESAQLVGSIIKGRVQNVLSGMQAAFVDIGQPKNAYLSAADMAIPNQAGVRGAPPISRVLRKGQELVVQIVKEALGNKGARATTQITLPGRYLVLGTGADYVGLSRKIVDQQERDRISEILWRIKPQDMGLIARTVAEGAGEQALLEDLDDLLHTWGHIQAAAATAPVPSVLHREEGLIARTIRDVSAGDVDRILVENCPQALEWAKPEIRPLIKSYEYDLFEHYGIEPMVDKALQRRVWLPSGGNIYIDSAEALTVVDVNTGKFVGKADFDDTILNTNLEAAGAIARQLRVRDIGGVVVIDFIDMESHADRNRVLETLEQALKKDSTKSRVVGFTPLGLVEMTRKKVRQHLASALTERCRMCDGTGQILSVKALSWKAAQQIIRLLDTDAPTLALECSPALAEAMLRLGVLKRELEGIDRKVYLRPLPGQDWDSVRAVAHLPGSDWTPDPRWMVVSGEEIHGL